MKLKKINKRNAKKSKWQWENDLEVSDIVKKLQENAEQVDTRVLLRPIFRWSKCTINDKAIEKMFAYVKWIMSLREFGDVSLKIAKQAHLKPSYAFNTLITCSQRIGKPHVSLRGFHMMQNYGYEPDVFTYTALIDVLARYGNPQLAIEKYNEMRQSSVKPNIVTYTTVVRAVSHSVSINIDFCFEVLQHMKDEQGIDGMVIGECLAISLKRKITPAFIENILKSAIEKGIDISVNERCVAIVNQLLSKDLINKECLILWEQCGVVTSSFRKAVIDWTKDSNTGTTGGSLGSDTPEFVRSHLVKLDLDNLISRFLKKEEVSRDDFETIIHQCRKRKWKHQANFVLESMYSISSIGWAAEINNIQIKLPPQPHLMPCKKTYESVLQVYFCADDTVMAWELLNKMSEFSLSRDEETYSIFFRGCNNLSDTQFIYKVFEMMVYEDCIVPTNDILNAIVIDTLGYNHIIGMDILKIIYKQNSKSSEFNLFELLLISCAKVGNVVGVEYVYVNRFSGCVLRLHFSELCFLMACCGFDQFLDACKCVNQFQNCGFLLKNSVYYSLVKECYYKFSSGKLTKDSRAKVFRYLQSREIWLKNICEIGDSFCFDGKVPSFLLQDNEECYLRLYNSFLLQSMNECCSKSSGSINQNWYTHVYPQFCIEAISSIRDRSTKAEIMTIINKSIILNEDPIMFLLKCIQNLPLMESSFRTQAKLCKLLLSVLCNCQINDKDVFVIKDCHRKFSLSICGSLAFDVIKEIDAIFGICCSFPSEFISFVDRALQTENNTKIFAYLELNWDHLNTDELVYTLNLVLIDAYLNGSGSVIQFLKPKKPKFRVPASQKEWKYKLQVSFIRNLISREEVDLARRLMYQFNLQYEEMFKNLVSNEKNTTSSSRCFLAIDPFFGIVNQSDKYFSLPPRLSDKIYFLSSIADFSFAEEILRDHKVMAIDLEWRPDFYNLDENSTTTRCSILQVAVSTHIFIFDLLCHFKIFEDFLYGILSSPNVLKLGFGMKNDIEILTNCFTRYSFGPSSIKAVIDLSTYFNSKVKGNQKGLSKIVEEELGKPLLKDQQVSDWEIRPLTEDQIQYAALDAYCLLQLYEKSQKNNMVVLK